MKRTQNFWLQGKGINFEFHEQSKTWVCILTNKTMVEMIRYEEPLLDRNVDTLELTVRASNCLRAEGVEKIRQLIAYTPNQLSKVSNLGRITLREIEDALSLVGLGLSVEVEI
jgi:DNA-directed RNA polymerase alpha subunit